MLLHQLDLESILYKTEQEIPLSDEELSFLLGLRRPAQLERLFATARKLRERYFGGKVFLYGFVYFSTFCRNNCNFCLYSKSNHSIKRYRKSGQEILAVASRLAESGVHLLDLTMGEDPSVHTGNGRGFDNLFSIVEMVKRSTELPLMISPGVVSEEVLRGFKQAGVDWYACYQETHNELLYNKLRVDQSYQERIAAKTSARQLGLLIEEGLLTGVGDSDADVIHSLRAMQTIHAHQVRVMSFVPQPETPMAGVTAVSRIRELVIIAVLRIIFPGCLIPASLDVDGLTGLTERLQAGANVVTSIIPPQAGLAGVSQSSLDIEDGKRTVSAVIPVLAKLGIEVAGTSEYASWVAAKRKSIVPFQEGAAVCE